MFQDEYVKSAWWFTIKFTFWNVLIQNVFALLFAVILDSGIRCKKIYRTILFIPCLISSVVAGFIWLRMFSNILPAVTEFLSINLNLKLFFVLLLIFYQHLYPVFAAVLVIHNQILHHFRYLATSMQSI